MNDAQGIEAFSTFLDSWFEAHAGDFIEMTEDACTGVVTINARVTELSAAIRTSFEARGV